MPKRVAVIRVLLYVGDEDRVHDTLARVPKFQGPYNRLEIRELSRQDVTLDLFALHVQQAPPSTVGDPNA